LPTVGGNLPKSALEQLTNLCQITVPTVRHILPTTHGNICVLTVEHTLPIKWVGPDYAALLKRWVNLIGQETVECWGKFTQIRFRVFNQVISNLYPTVSHNGTVQDHEYSCEYS